MSHYYFFLSIFVDKSPRTPKQSPKQRKVKRTAGSDD